MKYFFKLLLGAPLLVWGFSYDIDIVGLKDEKTVKALFDVSDLVQLQERPPASLNGLRYRAAGDIPQMLKVMRAYGYYDAAITFDIESTDNGAKVYLLIRPGLQYKLASYEIFEADLCSEPSQISYCGPITPERLGLKIGAPAYAIDIVNAELSLLTELSRCGYPLATIEKRRVIVDMAKNELEAASCIQEGPFAKFGPVTVYGLENVKSDFVLQKLGWTEGQSYNTDFVELTQKRLLNSDLFSSVMITHDEEIDALGELPMRVRITEAKHKQISIGAFYATVDGFGASFQWSHRNIRGLGEIIYIDGEFSKRYLSGKISYRKNDFLRFDQSYRAIAEISREDITAYTAFSYSLTNIIERKISEKSNWMLGLEVGHYNVYDSGANGTYLLLGLPFFIKWNNADDTLNPTTGGTITYQMIPYQSLDYGNQQFLKQRITGTFYLPLGTKRFVFASRIQFGSVAGTKASNIPLPKLFLGGSEDDLRGYKYKTVSPLNNDNQPLGGRSAIFLTAEARVRLTQAIGIVSFADFGTVTGPEWPQFNTKWLKSVGGGVRYFTFFGPLRLDVGFPLNPRNGIDPFYQLYVSIGQAF